MQQPLIKSTCRSSLISESNVSLAKHPPTQFPHWWITVLELAPLTRSSRPSPRKRQGWPARSPKRASPPRREGSYFQYDKVQRRALMCLWHACMYLCMQVLWYTNKCIGKLLSNWYMNTCLIRCAPLRNFGKWAGHGGEAKTRIWTVHTQKPNQTHLTKTKTNSTQVNAMSCRTCWIGTL
jgi:hypothetical protein